MMALAQELGVDELRSACEDHVTSTLSISSACIFLSAAMDIEERSPGKRFCLHNIKLINKATAMVV